MRTIFTVNGHHLASTAGDLSLNPSGHGLACDSAQTAAAAADSNALAPPRKRSPCRAGPCDAGPCSAGPWSAGPDGTACDSGWLPAHPNTFLLLDCTRLMRRLLPGATGTTKYSSASSPSGIISSLLALQIRSAEGKRKSRSVQCSRHVALGCWLARLLCRGILGRITAPQAVCMRPPGLAALAPTLAGLTTACTAAGAPAATRNNKNHIKSVINSAQG